MTKPSLERSVFVAAQPDTVFSFFERSDRFAAWWGAGSVIAAEVGHAMKIVYPNQIVVSGAVTAVEPGRSIAFTYGYEDGKGPCEPGSTLVEFELEELPDGTLLQLAHTFEDESTRDLHVPGWRYQLSVAANRMADAQHTDLDELFDAFFAAQMLDDEAERRAALEDLVADDFTFRDNFASIRGAGEFAAHLQAARQHGAAPSIERDGPVRHCQGTAVCDWICRQPDGSIFLTGTNVAQLAPDGRLGDVCGLWEMPSP